MKVRKEKRTPIKLATIQTNDKQTNQTEKIQSLKQLNKKLTKPANLRTLMFKTHIHVAKINAALSNRSQ